MKVIRFAVVLGLCAAACASHPDSGISTPGGDNADAAAPIDDARDAFVPKDARDHDAKIFEDAHVYEDAAPP